MGNNPRSDKTDKAIREALLEEIHEKPIEEVSVSAICKRAGVNRSTFYRRYSSPQELLETMRGEYLDKLRVLNASSSSAGDVSVHVQGLSLIKEQMGVIQSLQGPNNDEAFLRSVLNAGFASSATRLRTNNPNMSPRETDLLYFFIAGGTIQVILKWLEEGAKDDIPDLAEFLADVIYRCARGENERPASASKAEAAPEKAPKPRTYKM